MTPLATASLSIVAGFASAAAQDSSPIPPNQDSPVVQDDAWEDDNLVIDDELFDDGLDELLGGGGASFEVDALGDEPTNPLRSWKGFLEIRPRVYVQDRDEGRQNEQFILEGELELDFELGERTSAFLRPRVLVDVLDGDYDRFEPYEAYIQRHGERWDLRVGQFVENWGIVDTFNPIDVVNRRDFASDILDLDRLGEFGGRWRWFAEGNDVVGEPTWSLYALPVWRATPFAPEDQRFSFGSSPMAFDEDRGFEPTGAERPFIAARFASTLQTPAVNADVQLLAARGPGRTPNFVIRDGATLVPAYYGETTVGLGFRAVANQDVAGRFLSTWTWKAEAVYRDPYTFEEAPIAKPDDYAAVVVGVDREFYDVVHDQDALTLTLEYAREDGADDFAARLRPFRNDLIVRTLWERNDFARSSLETRTVYDFETGELLGEVIYESQLRPIDDDVKLRIQVQWFDPPGSNDSLFDLFPNNSSVAIGLRWDF